MGAFGPQQMVRDVCGSFWSSRDGYGCQHDKLVQSVLNDGGVIVETVNIKSIQTLIQKRI